MSNRLTIDYDGTLAVSGYGTIRLGDTNLSSILAHAFVLGEMEYKEIPATVHISIKLKDEQPAVKWEDD